MTKETYKIGKKIYKNWDDYEEAIREYADEHIDELEDVKFEFGCSECDKLIKGKKRSKSFPWKKNKKRQNWNYDKDVL